MNAAQSQSEPLSQEMIQPFVSAGHGNLAAVQAMLADTPALLNARYQEWDETALEAASHVGNRPIAEFLLAQGAPMNIFTAAMLGRTEDVRAFLAADPALAAARGVHGISLLFHAAMSGKVTLLALLYEVGGAQALRDAGHALHGAVNFGHLEAARWLLEKGADANGANFQGKYPLDVALAYEDEALAALLQAHGGRTAPPAADDSA